MFSNIFYYIYIICSISYILRLIVKMNLLEPHNLKNFLLKNFKTKDSFTCEYLRLFIEKKEGEYIYYNNLKESLTKLSNVNFLSFEYKSIDNKTVQFYKIKNQ